MNQKSLELPAAPADQHFPDGLSWQAAAGYALLAVAAFHAAYLLPRANFLIAVFLFAAWRLSHARSQRIAWYFGIAAGYAIYAPHLHFFYSIFSLLAVLLWLVLPFWLGAFLLLSQAARQRFGRWGRLFVPFIWLGFEYFRSELYILRFSWLIPGYAFADRPSPLLSALGMYGVSFLILAVIVSLSLLPRRWALGGGLAALLVFAALCNLPLQSETPTNSGPLVVGVQLEGPEVKEVTSNLDAALARHPAADLLVLSEYTFQDVNGVPDKVKDWCRINRRHLVVGSVDPAAGRPAEQYFNTAFVVGPTGEIVFKQAKAVPIQFFADGLPAEKQELWDSPWGKLGFCVCYDLSYTRVIDRLIRLGAQGIVAPTMDVEKWGEYEHVLHARVAPIRAAECGVPIFRLCSSGISQVVTRDGAVIQTAPFPGPGEIIASRLPLGSPGRFPLDRYLAPIAVAVTALLIAVLLAMKCRAACRPKR